jgi:acetolactate synthase-1/2/3 large subunit
MGPGAASLTNGIAHAALDRCPVVAVTDDYRELDRGQYEHQSIDQSAVLGSLVKRSFRLTPDQAGAVSAQQAVRLTNDGRPGPVHVLTSTEALQATVERPGDDLPASACAGVPPSDGRGSLRDMLGNARRPVVLVGLGARRASDVEAVRRLCHSRNLPVLATYKGKGVFPETDPLALGIFTNAKVESALLERADAIVAVGLDPVELLPQPWRYAAPVVYIGRQSVSRTHVPFTVQLVGAIGLYLAAVADALPTANWPPAELAELIGVRRNQLWNNWDGFGPAEIIRTCAEVLPAAQVTVDAGAHMFAATELWCSTRSNQLLISNGLATMGFALPAAMAATVVYPEAPVLAFTGDGGLLMALGELRSAQREHMRTITVVFNDGSLSLIRVKQEQLQRPTRGVSLGEMDWANVAEAMGVAGFRCTNASELEHALCQAVACSGPSLIDCRIDGAGYGKVLAQVR